MDNIFVKSQFGEIVSCMAIAPENEGDSTCEAYYIYGYCGVGKFILGKFKTAERRDEVMKSIITGMLNGGTYLQVITAGAIKGSTQTVIGPRIFEIPKE